MILIHASHKILIIHGLRLAYEVVVDHRELMVYDLHMMCRPWYATMKGYLS